VGLDYFGARYFSGAQGRFTSPDWSAVPVPIPYADLSDPQTLNLYSYVRNNPLSRPDLDGHWWGWNDWKAFGSGVADTTYRPIVQAVSHPIDTVQGLGNVVMHPVDSAVAIKDAVVDTSKAALSGDPNALGKVTGTVLSTLATAGAGKAAHALMEGLEVGDAAKLLNVARDARDTLAGQVGKKVATVTAGYQTETGQVAAAACGGGVCAETNVVTALGGDASKVKFTEAVRPRTGKQVPVCPSCEATYGRDAFPPGTQFKTDQIKP
jgi:RHS repeat-associated protein